ncbi:acetamidase/formamidase family protein [Planctomycetota bacterium]
MKTVRRDQFTLDLSPENPAVLEVHQGERIKVECPCAKGGIFQEDGTASDPVETANPLAGPVAVAGIESGDTVAVIIGEIVPVGYGLSCGLVFEPRDGELLFLDELNVPQDPSIGGLGLAPRLKEEATDNMHCGPHGGNLDCGDMGPGATVFLRARVDGANLSFGDVHWAMGDGEINGTGVEGAVDAEITLHKGRNVNLEWPWIVRNGLIMTLGGGPDLRIAQRVAYEELMSLGREVFALERREMQGRITVAGDLKVCQSVCDWITVRLCLPLGLLGTSADIFLADILEK